MKNSNCRPELMGARYGRLEIVGFTQDSSLRNMWKWRMKCECGREKTCFPSDVKSGKVSSCGCYLRENSAKKASKFAFAVKDNSRLYNIYNKMKSRCTREQDQRYADYGGRGISVCDDWMNSFDAFARWAHDNGYADDLTIERIDVNGNYCPENCKWITLKEQNANKRNTVYVNVNGENVPLLKVSETACVSYDTLHNRVAKGWNAEEAANTPSIRENVTLAKRAANAGLKYATVLNRIHRLGWSVEEAISTPARTRKTQYLV